MEWWFKMTCSAIYWCIRKGFPLRSLVSCDICYYKIPTSTIIPHPYGITIADGVEIGEKVFISPNVTIGAKNVRYRDGWEQLPIRYPRIGNMVFIGAGTEIVGDVEIADGCVIGAGSVVVDSFYTKGTVIAGNPAREIVRGGKI